MAEKGKYVYDWPRPMVTVDAIVFWIDLETPKVLLIKRNNDPFKGQWAIPGGFIELDEELDHAVARELQEETGLKNVPLTQMHTFGTIGRDPRGRQITITYLGTVTGRNIPIKGGDDASEAKWFPITTLPTNLAFDHADVLKMAIQRLELLNFDH